MSCGVELLSVAVLGLGGVGRELLQQLSRHQHTLVERYHISFSVALVSDSSGYSFGKDRGPFGSLELAAVLKSKKEGKSLSSVADALLLPHHLPSTPEKQWAEMCEIASPGSWILVDCSATDATAPLLVHAIESGAAVVLANKKPVSASQEIFDRLTAPHLFQRLGYESTVGAGTPMVATLRRLRFSCDTVHKVEGVFSGTLGFLTSGLEQGKLYSALVNEAAKLGYTEPDPRDDLGGTDVARKALILARSLGWRLEMSDVKVEPIFPKDFAALTVPEFLRRLPELDSDYAERAAQAKQKQQVLRYVGTVVDGKCSVGLKALSKASPLGQLQGTQNMVEYHTQVFSPEPLVIQGSGAGAAVTVAGVLADMITVAFVLQPKNRTSASSSADVCNSDTYPDRPHKKIKT
eukprot:gb/GEZN01007262.1/.p1 GENE.gb/GEZN01007262.1/~~gb/GEZN01007262.1/.p1  ORF type:complete len:407 (+),score=57.56 gb/GEZN01007262.1/:219-1439(+)